MAIWAIRAYDELYGGLHGMCDLDIIEGSENFAEDMAKEMSISVIESYNEIYDQLEDDVKQYCEEEGFDYDENGEEVEDIREEVYGGDIAWDIHELDKIALPTLDFNELNNMFYNNPDEFLELYAMD